MEEVVLECGRPSFRQPYLGNECAAIQYEDFVGIKLDSYCTVYHTSSYIATIARRGPVA